jgi:hypothetical protein
MKNYRTTIIGALLAHLPRQRRQPRRLEAMGHPVSHRHVLGYLAKDAGVTGASKDPHCLALPFDAAKLRHVARWHQDVCRPHQSRLGARLERRKPSCDQIRCSSWAYQLRLKACDYSREKPCERNTVNALQIAAYALGFSVAAIAILAWLVIALDRIADRDVEERKKRKKLDLP